MQRRPCRERGYVLVLSAILLGVFLSLAAAAIDMGNVYVWQLRLDKAVRAGTLAGLGYRAQEGWQTIYGGDRPLWSGSAPQVVTATTSPAMAALLSQSDAVVRQNFALSFPPGTAPDKINTELGRLTATAANGSVQGQVPRDAYNPVTDKIDLYYQYDVPTFFAGRIASAIGGFPMCDQDNGTRCRVRSHQTAQLDYANILLLLDVSGSMNCEVNDATCACRTRGDCDTKAPNRIIDKLNASVTTFRALFNPFRDRIVAIPFNLAAQVRFGFDQQLDSATGKRAFGYTNAIYTSFTAATSNLTAKSNTNPCDALIEGMAQLNTLQSALGVTSQALKPFVVVFSDGAPNALRGSFSNFSPPSTQLPNDWYQFALEWMDEARPPLPPIYQGPSPLVLRTAANPLFDFDPTDLNYRNNNPVCGDLWSSDIPGSAFFFERALNSALSTGATGKQPGCLSNLDFTLPGNGTSVIQVPAVDSAETAFHISDGTLKSVELPYYCAIEAADQIRTQYSGTVYTIGLGNMSSRSPGTEGCDDPLQDMTDPDTRKDNFLTRLAFAPATFSGNNWNAPFRFSPREVRNFNSQCAARRSAPIGYTLTLNGIPNTSRFPQSLGATAGQYYPTSNPNDLPMIFVQVAKQILLRLGT